MKLKYLFCACAFASMAAMANDEATNVVPVNENTASPSASAVYTTVDSEFGGSSLSNNETYMAGTDTDGHRLEEWAKLQKPTVKFGGYIIGKYAWDSRDPEEASIQDGLNLRLVRLYVDGYVFRDFKYRVQLEVNGTPHVKDATLEWVHWKEFSVKAGQFKRAFTFEDPYNPFDVGVGDYSQLTKKMSGFSDRNGAEYNGSNGGRDLGVQIQGDLFPSQKDQHAQLHYQVATYNGQGINTWDIDKKKDFMGTVQYSPVKNLYLGVFGWKGQLSAKDNGRIKSTDRNRFAFGVKYESDWTVRAEYARGYGYKLSELAWDDASKSYKPTEAAEHNGDVADAFYATVGIPCQKWLKAYLKYDGYRDYANQDFLSSIYSAALNFKFTKNLFFQAQYNYVDNKTTTYPEGQATSKHTKYSQLWAQMYVRF